MLAKNLTFLARADAAGIVLGARVPIILSSRADPLRSRLASCAVAALYANVRRRTAPIAAACVNDPIPTALLAIRIPYGFHTLSSHSEPP